MTSQPTLHTGLELIIDLWVALSQTTHGERSPYASHKEHSGQGWIFICTASAHTPKTELWLPNETHQKPVAFRAHAMAQYQSHINEAFLMVCSSWVGETMMSLHNSVGCRSLLAFLLHPNQLWRIKVWVLQSLTVSCGRVRILPHVPRTNPISSKILSLILPTLTPSDSHDFPRANSGICFRRIALIRTWFRMVVFAFYLHWIVCAWRPGTVCLWSLGLVE